MNVSAAAKQYGISGKLPMKPNYRRELMDVRWKHPNTGSIERAIKDTVKCINRGIYTRNEAADKLKQFADMLIDTVPVTQQPSLFGENGSSIRNTWRKTREIRSADYGRGEE